MYLILKDYQRIIQTTELNAITSNDPSVRMLVEGSVQQEMRSYLIQKYDLASEFQDTQLFSMTQIYKGGNRIYLDAPAYSAIAAYSIGALTLQNGIVYNNTTAISLPGEAFDPTHWHALGSQYDLFFITLPYPLFDQNQFYLKQDKVFWHDKTYTAQKDSYRENQEDDLQSLERENIMAGNILPDDRNSQSAALMWGIGSAYSVAAGTLPTDTTKWTKGDNRNQYFVQCYMHLVVYELCSRITPNNIPEARHNNWLRAIEQLKSFAKGNTTAELPVIQPKQGSPIRGGGKVKQDFTLW
jgi:hypothetical protein